MPEFPAHIRIEKNGDETIQSVVTHCREAEKIANDSLSSIHLGSTAGLAALLHDMGKMKKEYEVYLNRAVHGEQVQVGSVNHTFTGVRYILEHFHTDANTNDFNPIVAELIAFSIGSHHGLFDCVDDNGNNGFEKRLNKEAIGYEESKKNFFTECISEQELNQKFTKATDELVPVLKKLMDLSQSSKDDSETFFYLGLLARLLTSAVIEGDRKSTAEFMLNQKLPEFPTDMRPIWKRCLKNMETTLKKLPAETPIQKARQHISNICKDFGTNPSGIFRLNVPTGGGKTLSSLRFALTHAAYWNKSHIIFASPLLSILDQNALVIRDYIQDNGLILEHHSNIIRQNDGTSTPEDLDTLELLTQNWDAPIIITTLAQLLNTLFSGKTSCVRRFHSLSNSVIVIDEVQTVPLKMLSLFNLAINFLSAICGATVVLCSATQPTLEQTKHSLYRTPEEIVPYDPELWKVFKRTSLTDAGSLNLKEIPKFAMDVLTDADSVLIVCNKKEEAAELFQQLSCTEIQCFHLSASMCIAHRRKTLEQIRKALSETQKFICISTQVIEAGVDISFDRVIRLMAGMDSIVQAAGRCNREGQKDSVPVHILRCSDENLANLQDIRRGKEATESLLFDYKQAPQKYAYDLSSDESIKFYYNRLYSELSDDAQDYPVKDFPSLYSLLSTNDTYREKLKSHESPFSMNQAFKLAGRLFQVYDNEAVDVLVPYGEGQDIIASLCSARAENNLNYFNRLLERSKDFSVSLYNYQIEQLEKQGGIFSLCQGRLMAVTTDFYDKNTGVLTKRKTESEVSII